MTRPRRRNKTGHRLSPVIECVKPGDMTDTKTRIIKRYANRKLYDTLESRYVTLDQISEMIRDCEDVKVIDNSSKEDLTSVTLTQIIFEEEKRKRNFLPLSALRKVIQSGGESLQDFVSQIQTTAAQRVGRVFRRDDGQKIDPAPVEAATEVEKVLDDKDSESAKGVRDFLDGVQQTIDDWQKRIDANLQYALQSVSPLAPLQKQVKSLRARIATLEAHLSQFAEVSNQRENAEQQLPPDATN